MWWSNAWSVSLPLGRLYSVRIWARDLPTGRSDERQIALHTQSITYSTSPYWSVSEKIIRSPCACPVSATIRGSVTQSYQYIHSKEHHREKRPMSSWLFDCNHALLISQCCQVADFQCFIQSNIFVKMKIFAKPIELVLIRGPAV